MVAHSDHAPGSGHDEGAAPAHAHAGHGTAHGHPPEAGFAGSPWIVLLAWVLLVGAGGWLLRSFPDAVPFAILLLPLLGFTVLALFGDAIRDQGEGAGACWLACFTVLTSFALAVASVYRVMQFPHGDTGLRFTQHQEGDIVMIINEDLRPK